MAGAFWFSQILKIGPLPRCRHPLINAEPPRSVNLHRADARPRELSASAWVAILVGAAILGTSVLQSLERGAEHEGGS
jgi:hypothetical protein